MWLKYVIKEKLTSKQCSPAAFGCKNLACTLGGSQGHFVMPICSDPPPAGCLKLGVA